MNVFPARRILVPTDLSPLSEHAWAWAKAVAAPGAAFEALYVYDLPLAPMYGMPYMGLPRAAARKAEAALRATCPGAAVRVAEGDLAVSIARRARRAGLVVMASHGRRGLDRALLGSVSESVARDAPAPVLVVRGAPRRVKSVLAPVNLTGYARRGLALAADAAVFFGAELVVLHVSAGKAGGPNPRPFLNQALAGLSEETRRAVRPRLVLASGNPVEEILRESRRHGLVVLTAHRKSLFKEIVLGTTAERVLRHARVPILTAPSRG